MRTGGRSMMRMLAGFMLLMLVAAPAAAQTTISVDIAKARLSWTWAQGTKGPVAEFRVKCGAAAGTYTTITRLADPAIRSVAVSAVLSGPGTYFCVVSAANSFGESANSNEVTFAAGDVPTAPSGFQIQAQ